MTALSSLEASNASGDNNVSCVVLIPIYRGTLEPLEDFSVRYSLRQLPGRHVAFIAPETLDTQFYAVRYPGITILRYEDAYFKSIQGYSRLLLSHGFYESFVKRGFEYSLILQTDAILLEDGLTFWCNQVFDYIGAPWPQGLDIKFSWDCCQGDQAHPVHLRVGNGGLSLRRNSACAALLKEFPQTLQMFLQTGSSEDIFFALAGSQSQSFVLPNERQASLFALELQPERYFAMNAGRPPMGGHAWWRYNQPFWLNLINEVPPVLLPATAPGRPVISNQS